MFRSYRLPRKRSRTKTHGTVVVGWVACGSVHALQALQLGMDFVQAPHRLLVLLDFPSGRLGHGRCQGSRMINRRWTQMDANGTRTAGTLPQCGRCLGFGSARPSLLRTECLIFVPRCGAQSTQCLSSGWLGWLAYCGGPFAVKSLEEARDWLRPPIVVSSAAMRHRTVRPLAADQPT
jgi:hypothetical protein